MEYLLARLHMHPADHFIENYLQKLEERYRDFVSLAAKPIERDGRTGEIIMPPNDNFRKYVEREGLLVPSRFSFIDLLKLECDIRYKRQYITLRPSPTAISATDIANFTFCPVSWSISKTFQVNKPRAAQLGTFLHEEHKLANFVRIRQADGKVASAQCDLKQRAREVVMDSGAGALFRDLSDSVVVFLGGSDATREKQWFVSRDNRYVGQPDYVFFNLKTKKHFVVEEKFHMIPRAWRYDITDEKAWYYENHMNQLRSYVYGIRDYGPLYGYLVYWRFSKGGIEDDDWVAYPVIRQVRARMISGVDRTDRDKVVRVYRKIVRAMQDHGGEFDESRRTPAKCAGCVNCILCGHKTGIFKSYAYPYAQRHLQTKRVPYPKELIDDPSDSEADELRDVVGLVGVKETAKPVPKDTARNRTYPQH